MNGISKCLAICNSQAVTTRIKVMHEDQTQVVRSSKTTTNSSIIAVICLVSSLY